MIRFLLLAIWLILLNACGFHLRDSEQFHFSSVHIQSESADHLAQEIKQLLLERGINVVSAADTAPIIISLHNEKADKRVLTVSAVSGKLAEVELNVQVELGVHQPDGTTLLEKQTLSLLRDYNFDETAVLAMGAEEDMLREEMFQDLIAQIMRRLSTIKVSKQ